MRAFVKLLTFLTTLIVTWSAQSQVKPKFHPDRVIVKLKKGTTPQASQSLKTALQANVLKRFSRIDIELWQIKNITVESAVQQFKNDSRIEYLEPDYILTLAQNIPNDPQFSQLWGLHNTGQTGGTPDADIDAPEAWDIQTGRQVLVGVIDTGVDYNHEDLAANMWTNPGEIQNNGIDDDGNGYIDDLHGWDFIGNDNDPSDNCGHGTHVAGTIAAVGNNSIGVTGVSWSAKIMVLKVGFPFIFGCSVSTSDAIEAILYASTMGAKLTTNSWGGNEFSQALYDAIAFAGTKGQLFIAAAGNGGDDAIGDDNDNNPHYPSNYDLDNIIAVAATDHNDNLAGFSNFGAVSVDLGAPGVNILSTTPGNHYALNSGTSMAAPHVAGAASLVLAQFPGLSALEIKQQILNSVDPISALAGKTVTGGRLNVHKALSSAIPVDLVLTNTNISGATTFEATNSITAGPSFNILGGANVTFHVVNTNGTGIILKPGFTAATGCTFRAYLGSGSSSTAQAGGPVADLSLSSSPTKISKVLGEESSSHLRRVAETDAIPQEFSLAQNYPNPFNPTTTITFGLPEEAKVTLKVYNLQGQEVRTLVDGVEAAGYKSVDWDGKDSAGQSIPSGVYLYRLTADEFTQTRRMTLLK